MTHDQLLDQLQHELGALKRVMLGSREQLLGKLQLTRTQIEVLMALVMGGTQTVGDIAAGLAVSHSAATQTIETLVKRGLVERTPDERDRRIVRTSLSPDGQALADRLRRGRTKRMNTVFGALRDEELELMIKVVQQLATQFAAPEVEGRP